MRWAAVYSTIACVAAWAGAASGQTITWVGGGDGRNWSDPANWSPSRLPDAGDEVLIPPGHMDIWISGVNASARTLAVQGSLVLVTGSLNIAGSAEVSGRFQVSDGELVLSGEMSVAGRLSLQGGTVSGHGDLVITGELVKSRGTVVGDGRIVIETSGAARIVSPSIYGGGVSCGRVIENSGMVVIESLATLFLKPPGMINHAGGTIAAQEFGIAAISVAEEDSASTSIVNDGVIESGGAGQTHFEIAVRTVNSPGSVCRGGGIFAGGEFNGRLEPDGMTIKSDGDAKPRFGPTAVIDGPGSFCLSGECNLPAGVYRHSSSFVVDGEPLQRVTLNEAITPEVVELRGGTLRLETDQTWGSVIVPARHGRVELNGIRRLTITQSLEMGTDTARSAAFDGAGVLVLAQTCTTTGSGSGMNSNVENRGMIADGITLFGAGVLRNMPGGVVRQGVSAMSPPGGLVINSGVIEGPSVLISAELDNRPEGIVRATSSTGNVIVQGPGRRYGGTFRCGDGAGAMVLLSAASDGPPGVVGPGVSITGSRLELGNAVLEPGAGLAVGMLVARQMSPGVRVRDWNGVPGVEVGGGSTLLVETGAPLPPTSVLYSGELVCAGDLTVGSTLNLSGTVAGGGELLIPEGTTLSISIAAAGTAVIRRPVQVRGTVELQRPLVLDDTITVWPGASLIIGQTNVTGTGRIINLGAASALGNYSAVFSVPFDQRGEFTALNASRLQLNSLVQRTGDELTGGRWRFEGSGKLRWPAGVTIGVIGAGASVALAPGTGGITETFASTLRRVDGALALEGGRDLILAATSGRLDVGGTIALSAGSLLSTGVEVALAPSARLESAWSAASTGSQGILRTSGRIGLAGTLAVRLGFAPRCGQTYSPILAGSVAGHLDDAELPAVDADHFIGARPFAGGVQAGYFPIGDYNGDGFLDAMDVSDYFGCFDGEECPLGRDADLNGDGFLDFFDSDIFVHAFEGGGC